MSRNDITATDRRLISALRSDSRASVTTLAEQLGVSRATVQNRLDRLIDLRIIRKFTIEVDASISDELVKAVSLIGVESGKAPQVIAEMKQIPEVEGLYTTNGAWSLVAHIQATNLAALDSVLKLMQEIDGLVDSSTNILLNTAES